MSDDELPDINVTRGEKALATVLTVFLVIGALWVYFVALPREDPYGQDRGPIATAEQQRALGASETAERELEDARSNTAAREAAYERAREEYRTDLDAGTSAAQSRRAFERARTDYASARRSERAAQAEATRLAPAAEDARRAMGAAEARQVRELEAAADRAERNTALLRLAWVLLTIALAFWLFNTLRRRHSAYFVAGVAAISAATIQALVMAFDYLGDEIDLQEAGPLVIAVAGISASVLALVALERYLARRAPRRRVRRGQCPYCSYPARDRARHCEGCGRALVAACATCDQDRRVGTPHCAACGAA